MTLAPVFRSPEAVNALQNKGYWQKLDGSFTAHREATTILNSLLKDVVDEEHLADSIDQGNDLEFLQENFFLILFRSIFETIGCDRPHLDLYTLLNCCIRGVVLSGDNLFDDEEKLVLPLSLGKGKRFMSIVQMMCFQNLIRRSLEVHGSWLDETEKGLFQKNLLSALTDIGRLEGSEEAGINHVLEVGQMIENVHRVRGGRLFALAFIAPRIGERGNRSELWERAEHGVRCLGTAFQIVDDLTDFEFDLGRGSHNIVVAQVKHKGTDEERKLLKELEQSPKMRAEQGWIEKGLSGSASSVLSHAKVEAETGFEELKKAGFWFDPGDALLFVRAIAGDAGFERIQSLRTG